MLNTVNINFRDGKICVLSFVDIMYDMCGPLVTHNILLWSKISQEKKQF